MIGKRPPPHFIPGSGTRSDEVDVQAEQQLQQEWSGGLSDEGRWLFEENYQDLGTSVWRASHSTSHPLPKNALSS